MRAAARSTLGTPYRYLLASAGVANLGDGMRFAALPLLSAALLDDALQVAAVTAATSLPWLLLGLPVGAYADRVDRVRMMVAADVLRAAVLAVTVALLLAGEMDFARLLAVAFLLGVGEVMFDCASFAVLPRIVPADRLELANGRLFTIQTVGRDLLGHLLGGVLYTVGRAVPFAVNALSFLASAALLAKLPPTPPAAGKRASGLWREVAEGIRVIARDRLLAALTVAGGAINAVFLGQVAILVIFVRDVLGWGPTGYAIVLAVGAIGGVVGGLVAERLVILFGRTTTLLSGVGLFGLTGIGISLGTVPTTLAGYFAMGLGLMLWNVVAVSMRQGLVPDWLRGRTIAAYRVVAWGTMPLGALLFGAAARLGGTQLTFAAGGASMLLLGATLMPWLAREPRMEARMGEREAGGQPPTPLVDFAERRGFGNVEPVGGGLEFVVVRAQARDGTSVVLRAPRGARFQSNANDPHVDTRALLRWEYEVTRHLGSIGFPVATPHELAVGDPDVLISAYLPDDGQGADQERLGALLRRLHAAPLPPGRPVASEGLPSWELLPGRIVRRWREVAALARGLPTEPPVEWLRATLDGRTTGSLVHMDVRAPNLRCVDGRVVGLLDWSNALIADPGLELGRLAEFALLPGNGIDYEAVLSGYGEAPALRSPAFWVYRLDAAVMLAAVFLSEAPDEALAPQAVERLAEIHYRLTRAGCP